MEVNPYIGADGTIDPNGLAVLAGVIAALDGDAAALLSSALLGMYAEMSISPNDRLHGTAIGEVPDELLDEFADFARTRILQGCELLTKTLAAVAAVLILDKHAAHDPDGCEAGDPENVNPGALLARLGETYRDNPNVHESFVQMHKSYQRAALERTTMRDLARLDTLTGGD